MKRLLNNIKEKGRILADSSPKSGAGKLPPPTLNRKNKASDMIKASLWMRKEEHDKIESLTGDISFNLWIMRAVRKQLAAIERSDIKG